MTNLIKVILFLLVNLAGFYAVPTIINIAVMLEAYPQLPKDGPHLRNLSLWLHGGAMWVWIGCALISIGYFFSKKPDMRPFILLAPLYGPSIYGIAVLFYFNYIYTV